MLRLNQNCITGDCCPAQVYLAWHQHDHHYNSQNSMTPPCNGQDRVINTWTVLPSALPIFERERWGFGVRCALHPLEAVTCTPVCLTACCLRPQLTPAAAHSSIRSQGTEVAAVVRRIHIPQDSVLGAAEVLLGEHCHPAPRLPLHRNILQVQCDLSANTCVRP